ncbi:MAG: ester cyclase [Candidatus Hodarchaeales archaeon]|jgi:predicted ester cyclase
MRREEKKTIVRRYIEEILNKGNFTAYGDCFPAAFIFNGSSFDVQQLAAMRESLFRIFPDFHLTIEDQIAEGDKVVTRVIFHGTHKGELMGVIPTGKQVEYAGIAIDRISDGKVTEMWHVSDDLGMLRQLGLDL